MIRIAIVDDEEQFVSYFEEQLKQIFRKNNVHCTIMTYTNGKDFQGSYAEMEYNLIFLDIDMPDISGIQLASEIRKQNADKTLIFVSGHDNFVFESIRYMPFRFIRKADLLPDTEEAVSAYCARIKENKKYMSFRLDNQIDSFEDTSKIVYFFSQRHDIFFLNERKETVRLSTRAYTMDQLSEQMYPKGFIRTHKTYLVNYLYIYKISGENVILKDRTKIPLSRIRITEVKSQYQIFLRRNDTL